MLCLGGPVRKARDSDPSRGSDDPAGLAPLVGVEGAPWRREPAPLRSLRPDSFAYATQLRLIGARIVAAANDEVGTQAVRTARVLAVGATPAPEHRAADTAPATFTAVPETPVKTRDVAADGFRQALDRAQKVNDRIGHRAQGRRPRGR